jgi:signal transduction histidine kinase
MKKLLPKLWAKITALALLCVFAAAFAASCVGIVYLAGESAYSDGGRKLRADALSGSTFSAYMSQVSEAYDAYLNQDKASMDFFNNFYSEKNSNFYFTVTDTDGRELMKSPYTAKAYQYRSVRNETVRDNLQQHTESKSFSDTDAYHAYLDELQNRYELNEGGIDQIDNDGKVTASFTYTSYTEQKIIVTGYVRSPLTAYDGFRTAVYWADLLFGWRYLFIAAAIFLFALCLFLFIFLLCAAGHKEGAEGIHLNWVDRIPFDLYLAIVIGFCVLLLQFYFNSGVTSALGTDSQYVAYPITAVSFVLFVLLAMSVFMTFAARSKAGAWWKNTVICYVIVLLGRFFRYLGHGVRYAFGNLPLCWKGALVWCGLCLVELIFMAACRGSMARFAAWWFLGHAILTAAVILLLIALRKLQKGGEALAKGDLAYQVDLRHLWWDFKTHGEHLNSIAAGMEKAVDEQMRAERFKTELITNVSHDIKTPLTSIVNYVDLMKKEDLQPEKAKEYLAVLDRQSARLKKLTEDLVEASKASTGSIPVNLERTDLNVLLPQVAGEYDDRLRAAGLEPVLTLAPALPAVMADGRLLWRVFDNLLSNVCKYAAPGTRVYMSTGLLDGRAAVTFKNVSKYPLNIPASELLERFVRGDASRNTEGSGLGLAIAQSLTELQQGAFTLSIDGDLFKAGVSFPPAL